MRALALLAAVLLAAPPSQDEGKRAFVDVASVLQSPRCVNCHPAGDEPRVGDDGRPHGMGVRRDLERVGMSCQTCHRVTPSPMSRGVGAPPAVKNWHLPPAEHPMIFEGRTVSQLCAQLRDPVHNGGKDGKALVEHVSHDDLVLYGWDPGGKRTSPPIAHDAFVARMSTWVAAGMPCP